MALPGPCATNAAPLDTQASPRRTSPRLVAAGALLALCATRGPQHTSAAAPSRSCCGADVGTDSARHARPCDAPAVGLGPRRVDVALSGRGGVACADGGLGACFTAIDAAAAVATKGMPAARSRSVARDGRWPSPAWGSAGQYPRRRADAASTVPRSALSLLGAAAREFLRNPLGYMTIPFVAAVVGYGTNWVGVKMIFYPIGFWGFPLKRWPGQPLGLLGWQGIVPCKVKKMSARLVDIITTKLLKASEAFSNIDPERLATLLEPCILDAVEKDAPWGEAWLVVVKPNMKKILIDVAKNIQTDIDNLLDLREVVGSAFLTNKVLLGELFQKAGREELRFLVDSGFGFGFFLGIIQMILWILFPNNWVLPVGGALVGYITNWVAIKLIFEPVEETQVGPLVLQGLFQKRQPEVSVEFSEFLDERVLTSPRLIDNMVNGQFKDRFETLVRSHVPGVVPPDVVQAAIGGFRKLADEPATHPVHAYVGSKLGIQGYLTTRLKALSSAEFEGLLHPVFEEDEIILIIAGGVLGAAAGFVQMVFGWGGPPASSAVVAAAATGTAAAGAASTAMLLPVSSMCRLWWIAAVVVAGVRAARSRLRRAALWRVSARGARAVAAAGSSGDGSRGSGIVGGIFGRMRTVASAAAAPVAAALGGPARGAPRASRRRRFA